MSSNSQLIDELYQAAIAAQGNAYAPYSGFVVGAAICDEQGHIHQGCNVENAAYPIGCCAEQSAVSQMMVNGGRVIKHILVLGQSGHACPPCGACRQIIFEHSDGETQIHLETDVKKFNSRSISQLLPEAFHHSQLDK